MARRVSVRSVSVSRSMQETTEGLTGVRYVLDRQLPGEATDVVAVWFSETQRYCYPPGPVRKWDFQSRGGPFTRVNHLVEPVTLKLYCLGILCRLSFFQTDEVSFVSSGSLFLDEFPELSDIRMVVWKPASDFA